MNAVGLMFWHMATVLDSGWITDRKAPGRIGFIHHWTITYNESIQKIIRISGKVIATTNLDSISSKVILY